MPIVERIYDGFLPGLHAIDAYGAGGFRFGGMSHRGSLLFTPGGVRKWDVASLPLTPQHFADLLPEAGLIDILLIGTGGFPAPLSKELRTWLQDQALRSDVMTTTAAAMTYNVLLSENRRVAAALMAVD
jgi:uncharacterized protein